MTKGAVSFTFDLEDHQPDEVNQADRYPRLTHQVLDHLDRHGVIGTFFVLGCLAESRPELVAEVAQRGHEVALHSWDHTPLPELGADAFRDETLRGKKLLEDIVGEAVVGYRAPVFSLTPEAAWAPAILEELGFRYSSSVLPAWNPLFGWPGAPSHPFRWAHGPIELPCPVLSVGSVGLPFLGGVYARVLPLALTDRLVRATRHRSAQWAYCHPYDFDAEEPYWVVPELGRLGSRLLWMNRRNMFARIDRLVAPFPGQPLRDVASDLPHDLDVFDPPEARPAPGLGLRGGRLPDPTGDTP